MRYLMIAIFLMGCTDHIIKEINKETLYQVLSCFDHNGEVQHYKTPDAHYLDNYNFSYVDDNDQVIEVTYNCEIHSMIKETTKRKVIKCNDGHIFNDFNKMKEDNLYYTLYWDNKVANLNKDDCRVLINKIEEEILVKEVEMTQWTEKSKKQQRAKDIKNNIKDEYVPDEIIYGVDLDGDGL